MAEVDVFASGGVKPQEGDAFVRPSAHCAALFGADAQPGRRSRRSRRGVHRHN
jgi:hypothetical protein